MFKRGATGDAIRPRFSILNPALVDSLCGGNGRTGSISGFVTLNKEDCTKIYRLML